MSLEEMHIPPPPTHRLPPVDEATPQTPPPPPLGAQEAGALQDMEPLSAEEVAEFAEYLGMAPGEQPPAYMLPNQPVNTVPAPWPHPGAGDTGYTPPARPSAGLR